MLSDEAVGKIWGDERIRNSARPRRRINRLDVGYSRSRIPEYKILRNGV